MAATADMFQTIPIGDGRPTVNELEFGCSVVEQANFYGPLSVSVPGFMGGVGVLSERWGRLPWKAIVEPAKVIVGDGIPYARVAKDVEFKRAAIERYPASVAAMPEGVTSETLWMRPDLVRTLERLGDVGWRDFYSGEIGQTIADVVQEQGGILTREDMATFVPRITQPIAGKYRGADIYTAIAQNGGFSVLDGLADLERRSCRPIPTRLTGTAWRRC